MPGMSTRGEAARQVVDGAAIAERRERRGWSQQDLATRAGLAIATISSWEQERVAHPTVDALGRLAAVLGCRLDDLVRAE